MAQSIVDTSYVLQCGENMQEKICQLNIEVDFMNNEIRYPQDVMYINVEHSSTVKPLI